MEEDTNLQQPDQDESNKDAEIFNTAKIYAQSALQLYFAHAEPICTDDVPRYIEYLRKRCDAGLNAFKKKLNEYEIDDSKKEMLTEQYSKILESEAVDARTKNDNANEEHRRWNHNKYKIDRYRKKKVSINFNKTQGELNTQLQHTLNASAGIVLFNRRNEINTSSNAKCIPSTSSFHPGYKSNNTHNKASREYAIPKAFKTEPAGITHFDYEKHNEVNNESRTDSILPSNDTIKSDPDFVPPASDELDNSAEDNGPAFPARGPRTPRDPYPKKSESTSPRRRVTYSPQGFGDYSPQSSPSPSPKRVVNYAPRKSASISPEVIRRHNPHLLRKYSPRKSISNSPDMVTRDISEKSISDNIKMVTRFKAGESTSNDMQMAPKYNPPEEYRRPTSSSRSRSPTPKKSPIQKRTLPKSMCVPYRSRSRSRSPINRPLYRRRGSSSPINRPSHSRSRSPDPVRRLSHQRRMSPSPSSTPPRQRRMSPSPARSSPHTRGRSSNPVRRLSRQRRMSPSPVRSSSHTRGRLPLGRRHLRYSERQKLYRAKFKSPDSNRRKEVSTSNIRGNLESNEVESEKEDDGFLRYNTNSNNNTNITNQEVCDTPASANNALKLLISEIDRYKESGDEELQIPFLRDKLRSSLRDIDKNSAIEIDSVSTRVIQNTVMLHLLKSLAYNLKNKRIKEQDDEGESSNAKEIPLRIFSAKFNEKIISDIKTIIKSKSRAWISTKTKFPDKFLPTPKVFSSRIANDDCSREIISSREDAIGELSWVMDHSLGVFERIDKPMVLGYKHSYYWFSDSSASDELADIINAYDDSISDVSSSNCVRKKLFKLDPIQKASNNKKHSLIFIDLIHEEKENYSCKLELSNRDLFAKLLFFYVPDEENLDVFKPLKNPLKLRDNIEKIGIARIRVYDRDLVSKQNLVTTENKVFVFDINILYADDVDAKEHNLRERCYIVVEKCGNIITGLVCKYPTDFTGQYPRSREEYIANNINIDTKKRDVGWDSPIAVLTHANRCHCSVANIKNLASTYDKFAEYLEAIFDKTNNVCVNTTYPETANPTVVHSRNNPPS